MTDPMMITNFGWQLIDTAPRDGTPVLLFHPAWDMFEVGVYNPELGRWQERTGDLLEMPTRWMALPPPPEAEASSSSQR